MTAISPVSQSFGFSIDWGDGSQIETFTGQPSPFIASHQFRSAGSFNPTFTVSDGANTLSATVANYSVLSFELQQNVLAIGATDGGLSDDDILTIARTTQDLASIQLNGQTLLGSVGPFQLPTGGIRVYSSLGNDQLIVRGGTLDEQIRVQPQTIIIEQSNFIVQTDSQTEVRRTEGFDGNDQFIIEPNSIVQTDGGIGLDTIQVLATAGTTSWQVTGLNSGIFTPVWTASPQTFSNFESLRGSDSSPDSFTITSAGTLTGSITGGSGLGDSLSTQSGTGSINWAAGTASGVLGGFTGIDIVSGTGGAFTGPNADATWNLTGPGSGTVTYGSNQSIGFTGYNTLIGGSGNDAFVMGLLVYSRVSMGVEVRTRLT